VPGFVASAVVIYWIFRNQNRSKNKKPGEQLTLFKEL